MAENKIYLRPSADISVEHGRNPTDTPDGQAYTLINEEVADGGSTYISAIADTSTPVTTTSSFALSGTILNVDNIVITKANICYNSENTPSLLADGDTRTIQFIVDIGTSSFTSSTYDFKGYSSVVIPIDSSSFIDNLNNYINTNKKLPNISLTIISYIVSTSKIIASEGITQIYIELEYNIGVYRKVLGQYTGAFSAYKKIDNVWTKINNGYETIQSILPKKGHHQEYIAPIPPTCTETGLSEGYKCSICGEYIVAPSAVPANGHSTVPSGGHNICPVCGYVYGMGYTELVYHGTTTLSSARSSVAATTVGNYALFAGGSTAWTNKVYVNTVDAYNNLLTRSAAPSLTNRLNDVGAATIGNYALFAGGVKSGTTTNADNVDVYDKSLTKSTASPLSYGKSSVSGLSFGNYALFAGGDCLNNAALRKIEVYDQSLTKIEIDDLSIYNPQDNPSATTVGKYALIHSYSNSTSNTLNIFDESLTCVLRDKNYSIIGDATTVGNYALFAYSYSNESTTGTLYVYNDSLTETILYSQTDSKIRTDVAATIGNYALFAGGVLYMEDLGESTNMVYVYNQSLTKTMATNLNVARGYIGATTIGNYALFAGGDTNVGISDSKVNVIDVYKIQAIS